MYIIFSLVIIASILRFSENITYKHIPKQKTFCKQIISLTKSKTMLTKFEYLQVVSTI